MKNRICINISFLILIFSFSIFASPPDTLWTRVYGTNLNEYGRSVLEVSNGYLISSNWRNYIFLLRTDENGDTLWARGFDARLGMIGDMTIQKTQDGGCIIAGTRNYDFCLIKVDSLGNLLWTKIINVIWSDEAYSISSTFDNGFVITGFASYRIGVVKINQNGDILWTRTYGNPYLATYYPYSIHQTPDGGFIITGRVDTSQVGGSIKDLFIFKISSEGDSLWFKNLKEFSASLSAPDAGYSVAFTSDCGYIITGYQYSYGRGRDICLIKLDSSGNIIWNKRFGGSGHDEGYAVRETSDGGYIIVGKKQMFFNKGYNLWVIKTNYSGDTLWTKTIGGNGDEVGYCIQETSDGNYIVTGYTTSYGAGGADLYLIKLSGIVNKEEKENYNLSHERTEIETIIFKDKLKIDFSSKIKGKMDLTIYNVFGACLYKKCISLNSSTLILNDKNLAKIPKGFYFLKIFSNKKEIGRSKLIKIGGIE